MPKKWYDHEREWLNTTDIENVMKQYEKKYNAVNLICFFASSNFQKSKINIKNLSFKNRIGIAGGLDKNAEYFH